MGRENIGNVLSEYRCINCMGFWVLYFIDTTLLVMIHILCTQKWAGGHTVPSRYGASADTYNCRTYRHIKYLYMVFLVKIFYWHNVVGGGVNCTNDIYGGGIKRTCRYGCEHRHIQF